MAKAELTLVDNRDLAVVEDALFEDEAGAGLENVRPEDQAIPFLRVLQALSPQLKRTNAGYIDGAKEGDIFNTVDRLIWDGSKGVLVIPCWFRPTLVEWRPRSVGGGFVRATEANSPEGVGMKAAAQRGDDGKSYLANGNHVIDTAQHYVLQISEEGEFLARAVIAMASTQLRVSRQWMTMREQQVGKTTKGSRFTLPSYACVYRLTTVPQVNDKGEFSNWSVVLERRANAGEVEMARAFYLGVKAGEVKAADHDDEPTPVMVHNADIL